jgi:hypothetical protein
MRWGMPTRQPTRVGLASVGLKGGIRGGDIRLASLSPKIKDVFDLVRFTSLFHIYEHTVEAVGSF